MQCSWAWERSPSEVAQLKAKSQSPELVEGSKGGKSLGGRGEREVEYEPAVCSAGQGGQCHPGVS